MEAKDLLVTPIILIVIFLLAYLIRSRVTDKITRKYFISALTVKILGAILVGVIYQFYYNGGDTYNYFTHGSRHIWEAFGDDPFKGLKLLFAGKEHYPDTFNYSSQIWYYGDLPSYFIVRITAFFDLFTYHTYSATACLFAFFSFSGLWALYTALYRLYPQSHLELALAVLFVPSVFFWGSGIMKDTITLTALSWATYAMVKIFIEKERYLLNILLLLFSFYLIFSIKLYILLCFIPAVLIWVFLVELHHIRSKIVRGLVFPMVIGLVAILSYGAIQGVAADHDKYALDRIASTAEVTARWHTFVNIKEGGSGYILGDFDYTTAGMIRKLPLAINVSLFRPYLWEVANPVMLLAAIESLAILIFTLYILVKYRWSVLNAMITDPMIFFCMLFALSMAYAVGFSTYNFGSLVRYKIAFIPFYLSALILINERCKIKKQAALENS